MLSQTALSTPVVSQPAPAESARDDRPVLSESVAGVQRRYDRAGLWVAIVVTFGWYLAGVAPVMIYAWVHYGAGPASTVTWFVFAVLGVGAAAVVLRDGGHGPALALAICPILLAGSVLGSLVAHGGVLSHFNWPFTMVGWFAVLALWRRPLTELVAFYAANVLASGIVLGVTGAGDRVSVGRFIALCCGISALQITVLAGSRMVIAMARRGAEAEDELAATRAVHIAAEAVQAARRTRYETITGTVAHLLEDLAEGQLDLTDRSIRQQVAVAVTRLRRHLVESDEVPDQLWHELQVCADAAERQGIAVDLVAPAGEIPSLPVHVRRALTEPLIEVLAATATKARITVVATTCEVVVAIVADARVDPPLPKLHEAVESSHDAEGELLWVQARWINPSASP